MARTTPAAAAKRRPAETGPHAVEVPDHSLTRSLTYSVYGLGVRVNVPLQGLSGLKKPSRIDVDMTLGRLPPEASLAPVAAEPYYVSPLQDSAGRPQVVVFRTLDGQYFRLAYADGTTIVVEGRGQRVWATWESPATVEDTATYLLGPTLGFVLRLRGVTCLHASAVRIDDQAVAFVGASGAGKSTLAAAFAQQGYAVITDDVLAIGETRAGFEVQPAYPRVRLWEDSVFGLFGRPDALPLLTPNWNKRFLPLDKPALFQSEPLPLAAVYVLGTRAQEEARALIEDTTSRETLMAFIANTYTSYFADKAMSAQEFRLAGRLARALPARRITPRPDIGSLPALCAAIVDDIRTRTRAAARAE